jgi:hypothetical protein
MPPPVTALLPAGDQFERGIAAQQLLTFAAMCLQLALAKRSAIAGWPDVARGTVLAAASDVWTLVAVLRRFFWNRTAA